MATHYHQFTSISRSTGASAAKRAAYRHATQLAMVGRVLAPDNGAKAAS